MSLLGFATILAALAIFLIAPELPAQQAEPRLRGPHLRGVVVDGDGEPMAYVFITDESGRRRTLSDADGRFTIQAWRGRNVTFMFRRIGYHPTQVTRDFPGDTVIDATVEMLVLAAVIEEVVVRGDPRRAVDQTGFYTRLDQRLKGLGSGTFITYEHIQWRNSNSASSFLYDIAGVRVLKPRGDPLAGGIPQGRGGCFMNVYVDGQYVEYVIPGAPPISLDNLVPMRQVRAMEVYPSASEVPRQFVTLKRACGAILFWTRVD